eukprot:2004566-Rhodomonas_salina.4
MSVPGSKLNTLADSEHYQQHHRHAALLHLQLMGCMMALERQPARCANQISGHVRVRSARDIDTQNHRN